MLVSFVCICLRTYPLGHGKTFFYTPQNLRVINTRRGVFRGDLFQRDVLESSSFDDFGEVCF